MTKNHNHFAIKLGQQIKQRRLALKLTQSQLADILGVEINTISRMECGSHMPSLERLEQMSHVLKAPISLLLSEATTNGLDQSMTMNGYLDGLLPEERELVMAVAKKQAEYFKTQRKAKKP